ncbi:hypothetical protein [uncultured Brevundimonas sp.]|uniref:hypothetical protein n=1 Tax=uncultured Brevundimonas sp. TaxID=213418 RepID=UPI002618CACD|nr:hypothetical protein [uncultured Brevundimonas sp.]
MNEMRKITAFLPADLLEDGQKITGMGVSETLREALRRMRRAEAYAALRALRGTMDLEAESGVTLAELREDKTYDWTGFGR